MTRHQAPDRNPDVSPADLGKMQEIAEIVNGMPQGNRLGKDRRHLP